MKARKKFLIFVIMITHKSETFCWYKIFMSFTRFDSLILFWLRFSLLQNLEVCSHISEQPHCRILSYFISPHHFVERKLRNCQKSDTAISESAIFGHIKTIFRSDWMLKVFEKQSDKWRRATSLKFFIDKNNQILLDSFRSCLIKQYSHFPLVDRPFVPDEDKAHMYRKAERNDNLIISFSPFCQYLVSILSDNSIISQISHMLF